MKIINKIFLFISVLVVLSLGFTTTVLASTPEKINIPDGIIVGDYTLKSGDTTEGDIVTFGGYVNIEDGAIIYGSLAVIGGDVTFDGRITGDMVCIGGLCDIGDSASIGGSFVVVGADLNLSDEAVIIGEHVFLGNDFVEIPTIDIDMEDMPEIPDIPDIPDVPDLPETYTGPNIVIDNNPGLDFLQDLFSKTFMILAVSALALLIGVLFPKHLKKTSATIVNEPVKSAVLGLLTITVGPIALAILAITIILIPVSLIGYFALIVLVFYGWVAVGYILGERIAKAMNTQWDIIITTGIGTLALSTMAVLIGMIPCVGFLIYPIIFFIGLGGVFISQFGSREVIPDAAPAAPKPLPDEIDEVNKADVVKSPTKDEPEKE